MTPQTEQKIIAVNKKFYDTIGRYWNQNPEYIWDGWVKLTHHLASIISQKKHEKVRVLDVGAGNGRFYWFLKREFPDVDFEYIAMDFSDFGSEPNQNISEISFHFLDILHENWGFEKEYFDIVVAMGFIHHIPGERLLNRFMDQFSNALKPGGVGVVTTWQYMRLERLKKRVIDSEKRKKILEDLHILESELRPGDNFLDWVQYEYGVRFSHYFSHEEMQEIFADYPALNLLDTFLSDDREQNRNEYFVCKKITTS